MSSRHRLVARLPLRAAAALAATVLSAAVVPGHGAYVGSLISINPLGASAGVAVQITGTGFSTTASANLVTLTPLGGASAQSVSATAIATVDATKGIRRLNFTVPSGLPDGPAAVRVTNTTSGEVSEGLTLDVLSLGLPGFTSAPRGTVGLQVVITGSPHAKFTDGTTTRVAFGSGITVRAVVVETPQRLVATIDVAATAATGPRPVAVRPPNQSLLAADAFTITAGGTANRAPSANANGPYAGVVGAAIEFSSAGSMDPDNDVLTFQWDFGDGGTSDAPNPAHTYGAAGVFTVGLQVSDGRGGTATSSTTATVADPPVNRFPRFTSTPVTDATVDVAYVYQATAIDDDGDTLLYALTQKPSGMSIHPDTGLVAWTPGAADVGTVGVTVQVSDGRGGTATQSFDILVDAAAVVLTGIKVTPASLRFSELDATRALVVTGSRSDGSTVELTAAAAGTTYTSGNAFVASVSPDGVVTARGNGEIVVTARNGGFSDTAAVTVEAGVVLESLELTPASSTLRLLGATQQLSLSGRFSDGSIRDLTTTAGTVFESTPAGVASVSAGGLVVAAANGRAEIAARHGDLSATAEVIVAIPEGHGFIRGAVFDDSLGLPLSGATVTLLADGGGDVDPAVTAITDETGRYVLSGRAGDALVRLEKTGFTTVDRAVVVPSAGVVRALDARLTPIDGRPNVLQSVFGGQARDGSATVTLIVPPGALPADADVRVTPISAQGLAGRLPLGWSPLAGVDVYPSMRLSGEAMLVLPNLGDAAPNAPVDVVVYDRSARVWMVVSSGHVAADGVTVTVRVSLTGQFAVVAADAPPLSPPPAQLGAALEGLTPEIMPDDLTASGEVVPRSAPPGESARAAGRIGVGAPSPLPSGTAVQVHVSERFDLVDATQVVPSPFTEDILVHARPRPPNGGALGATFPITPSRSYTIQELMHGVVTLEVVRPSDDSLSPAGADGAVITTTEGDALVIPPGALAADTLVGLSRLPLSAVGGLLPGGFEVVSALQLDVIGAAFDIPAGLSVPAPPGLADTDQVLLVERVLDPFGTRRWRIAGVGRLVGDRLISDQLLGTLTFGGVSAGGQYFFLKSAEPLGFVTGQVTGVDGATPAALVQVTSSTAPFVDLTGSTGRYIVAARAAEDAAISARHLLSNDDARGSAHPPSRDSVVTLALVLTLAPPGVIALSPSAGAVNVPLDSSVTIDFSEPMDAASISSASVLLETGGSAVPFTLVVSQDRRRVTVRPASPLAGRTTYTLILTSGLKDLSGASLVPFAPASFTTLDPTRPPQPPPGQIVASLPDEDGFVLVTGTIGSADPLTPVTATNLRTHETTTVLALDNGSFRLRISAALGDDLTLTLRDSSGRLLTIALTQFEGEDGSRSVGTAGGDFADASGRKGSVLPRALVQAGTFRFEDASDVPAVTLDGAFSYVDRFSLRIAGAEFNRLASLSLTESQGRFAPASALAAPFEATGELTVPGDLLINSSLRYTATAQDAAGVRRSTVASTIVVAGTPDTGLVESAQAAEFPSVFLSAAREALQNQVVSVHAAAPSARVDVWVPSTAGTAEMVFLTRPIAVAGAPKLAVVDLMTPGMSDSGPGLRTSGRALPGLTATGEYAVVSSSEPLVFVTGTLVGPAGIASADGLPFVFETGGANGRFLIPVRAGQTFALEFFDQDGALRGTATGEAPDAGTLDIGSPLGTSTGQLTVAVEPDQSAIVDIGQPLVFHFSDAIDARTLPAGVIVTDPAGARVFGSFSSPDGGVTVAFRPSRRWRYGTTYRFGLTTSVGALSGARLSQPLHGQFTTFAPALLGTAAVGTALDVAVTGALSVVGTDTGARVVDVSSPIDPKVLATLTRPGGARGVALLPATTLIDRNGQSLSGTFAVIVSGDATSGGRLDILDVSAPASPIVLGTVQLTAIPGQTAPPGVPDAAGTPRQVVVTSGYRALVAIEHVGLLAVDLGQAIPNNPGAPGASIAGRYPAAAVESVTGVALLGDRVVVTGSAGLTVLDAATLEHRGSVTTGASLVGVSALPLFAMDVNGDGAIAAETDVFDLAVATGAGDGTVQFFRISPGGHPTLVSVVRAAGESTGVVLSAEERLAYVASGLGGTAIVDLDGPASVQPVDVDRNGTDDRLLAVVHPSGAARRVALTLSRGLGFVADGAGGLTIVRMLPARTKFLTILRDPVEAITGEEQSILDTRRAYLSDDGLQLTLDVIDAPTEPLTLSIQESADDGTRVLRFRSGLSAMPLVNGLNTVEILLDQNTNAVPRAAALSVLSSGGGTVARLQLTLEVPDPGDARVQVLRIGPDAPVLDSANATVQIGVAGFYDDGSVFNLTSAASGTQYASSQDLIATVDQDGRISGHAGGTAGIRATHGTIGETLLVRVEAPAVLAALVAERPHITMRRADEEIPYPLLARFSDDTETREPNEVPGLTFTSSDAGVVSVGADGLLRGAGAGVARVSATSGTLSVEVTVAVDPRTPTSLSGITVRPAPGSLSLDDVPIAATIVVAGTGALDALPVAVNVTRGGTSSTLTPITDLEGAVGVRLDAGDFVGSVTVTASVTDPATGTLYTDSETFEITAATGDAEPNDGVESAVPLAVGRTVDGTLDGTSDRSDTFALEAVFSGLLEIDLRLGDGVQADNILIVIRDAAGQELARFTPSGPADRLSIEIAAGAAFVTIESLSGAAAYSLSTNLVQTDVGIAAVVPMSGPPGTLVTIDGSGFSTRLDENQVFFSSIAAEVLSATTTRLQVRVPANAVNGAVEVISGDRTARIDGFATGSANARPAAFVLPGDPSLIREDPTSGILLDISRLIVSAHPSATRQQMDTLAAQLGGRIAGFIPLTNQHVFEFPDNRTFDGLNFLRQRLAIEPGVRVVAYNEHASVGSVPASIDIFSTRAGTWHNGFSRSAAFDLIRLEDAIDLVRSTPPFTDRDALKDVRVAVIDTGFRPGPNPNEFFLSVSPLVEYLEPRSSGFVATTNYQDVHGHGTLVSSILAAANDGSSISGVLNSLVDSNEFPFPLYVYRTSDRADGKLDSAQVTAALDHIHARSNSPIQVVNLSFGHHSRTSAGQCRGPFAHEEAIRALRGRALLVAGSGNDGVESRCFFPAAFAATQPHVMSIGAVAVANVDGTPNENPDDRAIWEDTQAPGDDSKRFRRCNPAVAKASSNCAPGVTLTAPGEDLPGMDLSQASGYSGLLGARGTSVAAPVVAGVAAILQTIRPTPSYLPPSQIRSTLTSTATQILGQWDANRPGQSVPMLRLDAAAAVEAVLPLSRTSRVYVADQEAPSGTPEPGAVIAISVDPLNGTPSTATGQTTVIPLTVTKRGVTLTAGRPRTAVLPPSDARLYVYATTMQYGDGVVVVNTANQKPIDFIPLSGAPFPTVPGTTPPPPFRTFQPRPPMVLSRDGRLLYVATNHRITIVNTVSRKVVSRFEDLPAPYNAFAAYFTGLLQRRLREVEQSVLGAGSLFTKGGSDISALEISPDGKTLYAAVRTGFGTGAQPGFVFSLNVNLYHEGTATPAYFNSPLHDYFQSGHAGRPLIEQTPLSDEPGDIAIAPGGDRLYLLNSGVSSYSPASAGELPRHSYALTVHTQSSSGNVVIDPNLVQITEQELADGTIVVNAPGVIDMFALPALGSPAPRYESSVNWGWSPSAASGGLVLSSSRFGRVFAKRPTSMAIRPDGRRALVSYFQTGNFGVLDVDGAELFVNQAARVAATPGLFTGVVGVTPSVQLGKDLVPVNPDDRRRLYPLKIEYAQSGRFAAAIHAGAVSFINDRAINEDLGAHVGTSPFHQGVPRPYYTHFPVCAVPPATWTESGTCEQDVVTTIFEYAAPGGPQPFRSVKGLAIAPLVELAAPRFGDRISQTTEVHLRWRHEGISRLNVEVFDLGVAGTNVNPSKVGDTPFSVGSATRFHKIAFAGLFNAPHVPVRGHRYRIVVTAFTPTTSDLSRTSVDVTLIR